MDPSTTGLNIKTDETHRLATKAAAHLGETQTQTVTVVLGERRDRLAEVERRVDINDWLQDEMGLPK